MALLLGNDLGFEHNDDPIGVGQIPCGALVPDSSLGASPLPCWYGREIAGA